MNFVPQTPSLQHVAGVKIVSHLWSRRDIFTQILRACNSEPDYVLYQEAREWKATAQKVESKVSALPLPELFIKQLISLIKPLGTEFITWLVYHEEDSNGYNFLALLLPQQLRWTMHGTVDYAKTAELMVKDERVSIDRRYEIACINCLEDEARQLFKSVPVQRKREYINDEFGYRDDEHRTLTLYFTWTLCGHVKRLKTEYEEMLSPGDSIHKYLFKEMLYTGCERVMCRYFLEKLNREEKEQVLDGIETKKFDHTLPPACSFMYFLSQMNEEQRERVIGEYGFGVLCRLLDWPQHFFFADLAKRVWPFESQEKCALVLSAIVLKISRGYLHFNYSQLFWECWGSTSAEFKRSYLDDANCADLLLFSEREEFIVLLLNEGSLPLTSEVFKYNERYRELFMDESAISFAALRECKERAELNGSDENRDEEKRFRSKHLRNFLDVVMRRRELIGLGEDVPEEDGHGVRSRRLGQWFDSVMPGRFLREGEEEESDDEDSDSYCELDWY